MADSPDRIALPIRVHDFLLTCAGRIDDDALTDARELLAMAELDRAVELVTASIVAGRIRLNADERDELLDLVDAVRSSPALVDRVVVDDSAPLPRHRFTTGAMDDPSPETGVLEAAGRVIEVLPDIRSLSCVWRTTPAGSPAGPIPQRLVLVETGPEGFAPSTAYRVEQSLRRAGIRAAVEVVQAGVELSDYHGDALAVARRLSLRGMRSHETHDNGDSGTYADPPSPRPVTTTRRRAAAGAHAEKRTVPDHSAARWQPRIAADEPSAADAEPEPAPAEAVAVAPDRAVPPFEDGIRPIHPEAQVEEAALAEPVVHDVPVHEPVSHESMVHEPVPHEPMPVEPEPTLSAQAQVAAGDPAAEADLSNRERELLRQLHEELAKREQSEPEPTGWQERSGHRRPVNPPGAEFNPADFRQPEFNPNEFGGPAWHQSTPMLDAGAADQTAVNGIPPYGSVQ
ncbi:MAG TPA: hypothetical protein VFX16_10910 [Pseudonocardiaceae bacterium]|nr:hypothetical protein [Pseudonocardiaceae bacterium]